jgi:hypothetical protein
LGYVLVEFESDIDVTAARLNDVKLAGCAVHAVQE